MSDRSLTIRLRHVLLSLSWIVLESSACSSKNAAPETLAGAMQTAPAMAPASTDKPRGSAEAGRHASVAMGSAGGAAAHTPSMQASAAGVGSAGVSGAAGLGAAGQAGQVMHAADDADAGAMEGSAAQVTIIAKAAFAKPAPALMIDAASCAAGSCTVAAPANGQLKVALTLEHNGSSDPMPVLARWTGCGMPTTTFFPVTPSGTSYVLNYETQFSDLHAGSTCTAEIKQGAWLVFAGNMSLEVTEGKAYCTTLQVSEMGMNANCFPPPGTKITIKSDLPRWDCINIAQDGKDKDMSYPQQTLSFTTEANQLISCTGAAQ